MERGGRLAAAAAVSDEILERCKPIAGTPADCLAAIESYREAGCTHVMLELWGGDRERQIELFATEVLPRLDDERRPRATDRGHRRGAPRRDRRAFVDISSPTG